MVIQDTEAHRCVHRVYINGAQFSGRFPQCISSRIGCEASSAVSLQGLSFMNETFAVHVDNDLIHYVPAPSEAEWSQYLALKAGLITVIVSHRRLAESSFGSGFCSSFYILIILHYLWVNVASAAPSSKQQGWTFFNKRLLLGSRPWKAEASLKCLLYMLFFFSFTNMVIVDIVKSRLRFTVWL